MKKKILNYNGFYFDANEVTAYYIEQLHNLLPEEQRVNTKDVSGVMVIFNNGTNRLLVPAGDITCEQLINNLTHAITSDDSRAHVVSCQKQVGSPEKHDILYTKTESETGENMQQHEEFVLDDDEYVISSTMRIIEGGQSSITYETNKGRILTQEEYFKVDPNKRIKPTSEM